VKLGKGQYGELLWFIGVWFLLAAIKVASCHISGISKISIYLMALLFEGRFEDILYVLHSTLMDPPLFKFKVFEICKIVEAWNRNGGKLQPQLGKVLVQIHDGKDKPINKY
jgi:hypothetical protein